MPIGMTPTKEHLTEHIIMLSGIVKIGKTSLLAQFKDVVFLLTERGYADTSIPFWHPLSWKPTKKEPVYIIQDSEVYDHFIIEMTDLPVEKRPKMVVIDTIHGTINAFATRVKIDKSSSNNLLETMNEGSLSYGKGTEILANRLNAFLTDLQKLNIGIALIGHLEERVIKELGKDEQTVFRSVIPDKLKPLIFGMADMIWTYRKEGKKRMLYTDSSMVNEAGSRVSLPERIDMGKTPKEAFENLMTAFYGRDGNKEIGKKELINRILAGEEHLRVNKIDSFDTTKRKDNSRQKHLGQVALEVAELADLEGYLQHLRNKAKVSK